MDRIIDFVCWTLSGLGTLGCVYLLYLNDWDLEKTLYGHTLEDDDGEMDEL